MDILVGDRLEMKKPHPCGSCIFEVLRVGMDFRLRCEGCGNTAVMDMDATLNGIVRQFRNHEQPSCTAYTPSAEVMRLDNAINRGLEQPDSPEAVMALILQGAAARYACCPEPSAESEPSDGLTEADWRRFQRAVSHITISQDTEVTLIFTDKKATGKDE